MPRNRKAARERAPRPGKPKVFGADAPEWALSPGYEVRVSLGADKTYRCPGCDHEIRAGLQHLVVLPRDAIDERRHWHTDCWRRELRLS